MRFPSSGDQMAGGGRLRDAGTRPRRVVAAAGPKMAGVVTGIDRGGRRSSGELGVDATVAGEARARHLRALGSGEEAEHDSRATRWPEACRQRSQTAAGFGHQGGDGYGNQTKRERGGNGGGAHRGCDGGLGELGEASEAANRQR